MTVFYYIKVGFKGVKLKYVCFRDEMSYMSSGKWDKLDKSGMVLYSKYHHQQCVC